MVMGQSCVVPSNCTGLWQRGNHVLYLVTVQDYGREQSKMDLLCMYVCVQIVVEGVVGSGVLGDIAIDDIAIRNGSCPHAG